jgi:hypothetical protein
MLTSRQPQGDGVLKAKPEGQSVLISYLTASVLTSLRSRRADKLHSYKRLIPARVEFEGAGDGLGDGGGVVGVRGEL